MANSFKTFKAGAPVVMKQKVLNWLKQFNTFCLLDSNLYAHKEKKHELLAGVGCKRKFSSSGKNALHGLQGFINEEKTWLFGHLGFELKVEEHKVPAIKEDRLFFPDTFFFEPETLVKLNGEYVHILSNNANEIFEQICSSAANSTATDPVSVNVKSNLSKQEYISVIEKLQQHIHRGDCYEINFCQQFFAENVVVNPLQLYIKLNQISPNPFSALYHFEDKWLVCASPERFLKKEGNTIISQPIKGTLKRAGNVEAEKQWLLQSEKERAENVMVVDLVRNDLSRICKEGSVHVSELFGIYSFPQVHQMISTIAGTVKDNTSFTDIINATFPMGSMTGAPKIRVLELIHQYEKTKRGIFSGALGYIAPDGDFDFNVVIRSLMYNESTKHLSYQAGSGITIYSNAEQEWEECIVKAKAITEILS